MKYVINLSGFDIVFGNRVLYFGYMPNATHKEKIEAAETKLAEIKSIGIDYFYAPVPKSTLSETDEAILNTNANVEYLVALKELEV